jgi:NAD(P)-dependent dehydrogenase (short-subunit alcohol dehydrogenase family)
LDGRGAIFGIRTFAVHPGLIETNLQRFITLRELQARESPPINFGGITAQGSDARQQGFQRHGQFNPKRDA